MTNTTTQVLYRRNGSADVLSFAVNATHSQTDALAIAKAALGAEVSIIRVIHPLGGSYGNDVDRFNSDHRYPTCRMGRYPGSDTTECDTHGAYVSHGIPVILR